MLTQSCTQCHKEHLSEESLQNAKGQHFCSAYCLKIASGKPVAPQLPPKKTLPLMPLMVVFALLFWGFWRLLAPGEVTQTEVTEVSLDLSQETVETASPIPAASSFPSLVPASPSPDVSPQTSPEASLGPSASGANADSSLNSPPARAFALARQAALLLPMDASRATTLAQESLTLYPNREAYRVLISYADRKDRAIEKEAYLKKCLALTNDTKSVDYCYIDKTPEAESSASEPDLFAPLPEPSLDAARQVAPPALDSDL